MQHLLVVKCCASGGRARSSHLQTSKPLPHSEVLKKVCVSICLKAERVEVQSGEEQAQERPHGGPSELEEDL